MTTEASGWSGLSILGRPAQPSKKLEAFPNHNPDRFYRITLETN